MNQKMHNNKMCFILCYYSQTSLGLSCDHPQGVTQDHTTCR